MIAIIDNETMFLFYEHVMALAKQQGIEMLFISLSRRKHQYLLDKGLKSVYLKEWLGKDIASITASELERAFPDFALNQCVQNDRVLKTFPAEKSKRILETYLEAISGVLETYPITLIIGEISWGVEYLLYHVAHYKSIRYVNPLNTYATSSLRLVFFDKKNSHQYFLNKKNKKSLEVEQMAKLRRNININDILGKKLNAVTVGKYFRKLKVYFLFRDSFDYRSSIFLKFNRLRILSRRYLMKFFGSLLYKQVDINDRYFYYPLHIQPEATPDIVAMYYSNQLELISQIARSLPFGTKLVVKEHPNASGAETLKRLLWIRKQNNVVLVPPRTSSKDLIKGSLGVITIAGTVGIEARLENKPVLLFSDVYYSALIDHVYRVTDFNELSKTLQHFLRDPETFECANCEEFLGFMDQHSSDCYIYDPVVDSRVLNTKNVNSFLKEIAMYNEVLLASRGAK